MSVLDQVYGRCPYCHGSLTNNGGHGDGLCNKLQRPAEPKVFTESEVKELLTGLLKEIEAKATGIFGAPFLMEVPLSDVRTLFNKILQ